MIFEPIVFTMKDGCTAILRPPEASDAANMLACLREESGETDFILTYPEDWDSMTVAQEESFLTACRSSPDCMMLICEVDGEIAGNCEINFYTHRMKLRHRAELAIALRKAYWGQGIATHMFETLLAEARRRPNVTQAELAFTEGNSRARAFYEKMGFRVVGIRPDVFRLKDGTVRNEYFMMLKL